MELKSRIPNEATLEAVLLADLSATTASVKREVGDLEVRYVSYRRKQRLVALSIFMILIIPNIFFFVFGSLLSTSVSTWSGIIGTLIFLVSVGVFIYVGGVMLLKGASVIKAFHGQVDKILFGKIFTQLGVSGELIEHTAKIDERVYPDTKLGKVQRLFQKYRQFVEPSPESLAMLEVLRQSELITEAFNTTKVDNLFRIKTIDRQRELLTGNLIFEISPVVARIVLKSLSLKATSLLTSSHIRSMQKHLFRPRVMNLDLDISSFGITPQHHCLPKQFSSGQSLRICSTS